MQPFAPGTASQLCQGWLALVHSAHTSASHNSSYPDAVRQAEKEIKKMHAQDTPLVFLLQVP